MVRQCCACEERVRSNYEGRKVTFHCFPRNEERRNIWINNVGKEKDWVPKNATVCSNHFTEDCFDREKLGGTWLKPTAVPTIFDPLALKKCKKRKQSTAELSLDNKEGKIQNVHEIVLEQKKLLENPEIKQGVPLQLVIQRICEKAKSDQLTSPKQAVQTNEPKFKSAPYVILLKQQPSLEQVQPIKQEAEEISCESIQHIPIQPAMEEKTEQNILTQEKICVSAQHMLVQPVIEKKTQQNIVKKEGININTQHVLLQPVMDRKSEQNILTEERTSGISQNILVQPVMGRKPEQKLQLLQLVVKPTEPKNSLVPVQQPRIMPAVPQILLVNNTGVVGTSLSPAQLEPICTTGKIQSVSQKVNQQQKGLYERPEIKQEVHPQLVIQPGCQTAKLNQLQNQSGQTNEHKFQSLPNVILFTQQPNVMQVPPNLNALPLKQPDVPVISDVITSGHTTPAVSYILQTNQRSENVTPEINSSHLTNKRKTMKFSDYTPECLQCPSNARKYMDMVKRKIERKDKRIRFLKTKSRRLQRRLTTLTNTCIDLKTKYLLGYKESNK